MVRDTSIAAHREDRTRLRDKIVIAMGDEVWTRRELAEHMNIQASTMSGQIFTLIEEGRVEEVDYRTTCEITGKRVTGIKRRTR